MVTCLKQSGKFVVPYQASAPYRMRYLARGLLIWSVLCICCLNAVHAATTELGARDFDNLKVIDLIDLYRQQGFEIVYSTDLVNKNWVILVSPPHKPPLERLSGVLKHFGLELQLIDRDHWLITLASPKAVVVEGQVLDTFSTPVPAASIEFADQYVTTDERGSFSVRQLPGSYTLIVSAAGFLTQRHDLVLPLEPGETIEITMHPDEVMEDIIVTASRYELNKQISGESRHLLTRRQIDNAPSLGDDPIRAVNTLPGTATIGFSSRPRVRGGTQDEVLVLFDDLELIEPFHLKDFQNLFSTLNPGTIQSVDFYTGGFPARFGNRLSGVLDITTQNVSRKFGGELGLTLFSTSALLYGSNASVDWLAAARRGNLDVITDIVNPDVGDPSYSDAILRVGKNFKDNSRIELTLLNYTDEINFDKDDSMADSDIDNDYLWLEWTKVWNDDLVTKTIISKAKVKHRRSGIADDEDKLTGSVTDSRDIRLTELKHSIDWKLNDKVLIDSGFYVKDNEAEYLYASQASRGLLADVLGNDTEVEVNHDVDFDGISSGIYLSAIIQVTNEVTIQPGIRFDSQEYTSNNSDTQLSARFGLLYKPTENSEYRFSAGRFFQPQGIHELQTTDGMTTFFPAQQSDHIILSYRYSFDELFSINSEIYYKETESDKPRFENMFNPFVLLPEIESDRIRIDAWRTVAKGIEVSISSDPTDPMSWWVNYSLAKVSDKVNGDWKPRTWDQHHTINAGMDWEMEGWNLAITSSWHSGWAETLLPGAIPAETVVDVDRIRNENRHREFWSINFRLSHEWNPSDMTFIAFIEVANVFNRSHSGGTDFEVEEDEEDEDIWLISGDQENLLPMSTSVGIIWRF